MVLEAGLVSSAVKAASDAATQILDSKTPPQPLEKLSSTERIADARATQAEQANTLRSRYGYALLLLVLLQIVAADAIFLIYAWRGVHWDIPEGTLNVWLGATVVQVIAVVVIVVHYLFPEQRNSAEGGTTVGV